MISALPFPIQGSMGKQIFQEPVVRPQTGPLGIGRPNYTPTTSAQISMAQSAAVPQSNMAAFEATAASRPKPRPNAPQAGGISWATTAVPNVAVGAAGTGALGGVKTQGQTYEQILASINKPPTQDPQLTALIAQLRGSMGQNDSGTISSALAAQRAAAYGELNNQALLDAAARGMTLGGGDYGKLYSELQAPIERQLMAGAADAQLQALQRKNQSGIQLAQLLSGMQSDASQRETQRQNTALNLYSTQQELALKQAMASQDLARGNLALKQMQEAQNQPLRPTSGAVQTPYASSAPGFNMSAYLAEQEKVRAYNEARISAGSQPPAGIFTGDMQGQPAVRVGAGLTGMSSAGMTGLSPTSPFHDRLNINSTMDSTRAMMGAEMNYAEAARRQALGLPIGAVSRNTPGGSAISGPDYAGSTQVASQNFPAFQAMYPPTTNARGLM